eukprot:COSAG03_NODE_727_length_6073_cov_3.284901_9_plen_55_part_00
MFSMSASSRRSTSSRYRSASWLDCYKCAQHLCAHNTCVRCLLQYALIFTYKFYE